MFFKDSQYSNPTKIGFYLEKCLKKCIQSYNKNFSCGYKIGTF